MKLKTKSLRHNLFLYFLLFSALILLLLYLSQIVFFNGYYKISQRKMLSETISDIEKNLDNKDYLNNLSIENEVCIQVYKNNEVIYFSDFYKHCAPKDSGNLSIIRNEFFISNKKTLKLEFFADKNPNKLIVYGEKLKDNTYIFANTTLQPMDKSITILKSQFLNIAIIIVILSFLISYLFSTRIASPIAKINKEAKKLSISSKKANFNYNAEVKELEELSETLSKVQEELSKTDEVRREFLANISHDLKTPLTMIEAYAASAKDLNYNNKEKRERDLNIIIDEAERLNSLVNDILTLSKIETNNELKLEKFDIKELIDTILKRFAIYENKGYKFVFNQNKNYYIEADKTEIERVIYNLIINAINYTGNSKKITINLKKEKSNLLVEVKDTGKGISKDEIDLVWNKYYRTNKRHRREVVGTGLGLSIVKQVLEKHNFEYGVKSTINKGSCFWFKCKIKE